MYINSKHEFPEVPKLKRIKRNNKIIAFINANDPLLNSDNDKPDTSIVAPEFVITTESFPPTSIFGSYKIKKTKKLPTLTVIREYLIKLWW